MLLTGVELVAVDVRLCKGAMGPSMIYLSDFVEQGVGQSRV